MIWLLVVVTMIGEQISFSHVTVTNNYMHCNKAREHLLAIELPEEITYRVRCWPVPKGKAIVTAENM